MPAAVAFPDARLPLGRLLLVGLWAGLLLAALIVPVLAHPADLGEGQTRYTVRLTLLYYGLAAGLLLTLSAADWERFSAPVRLARWCWTLSWAAYVLHVGLAFHHYHHWSHADAFDRTERLTRFGPGIYISYLFTLLWTADVAWWWLSPRRYAARPGWLGVVLHAFLAFIVFNGAVVFAAGLVRWASAALFGLLGLLLLRRLVRPAGSLQRGAIPLYHDRSEPVPNPVRPGS
jgi:hypothetical protein